MLHTPSLCSPSSSPLRSPGGPRCQTYWSPPGRASHAPEQPRHTHPCTRPVGWDERGAQGGLESSRQGPLRLQEGGCRQGLSDSPGLFLGATVTLGSREPLAPPLQNWCLRTEGGSRAIAGGQRVEGDSKGSHSNGSPRAGRPFPAHLAGPTLGAKAHLKSCLRSRAYARDLPVSVA